MIENLNLASDPFRNRTLPWTVAVMVVCVSLAALVLTISQLRQTRVKFNSVAADVRVLRTEEESLRAKATAVTESLTPDQLRTLDAAHTIVDRKIFSWSRLFADLEASLPQGVKVSRINVRDVAQSGGRTRAELELAVVARTPADITRMLATLAQSGIFSADLLTENKSEKGIESTLRVRYSPARARPAATNSVESAARVNISSTAETTAQGEAR